MRYMVVAARLRPGERLLKTAEGRRLVLGNLSRPKCRRGSSLFAFRIGQTDIELILGVRDDAHLKKVMHRIRILAVTEYNRAHKVTGTQRWQSGFDAREVKRAAVAAEARRIGRPRGSKALDPLP
jgi:hypothetical protein